MGSMKKTSTIIIYITIILATSYYIVRIIASFAMGHSFTEMDWNKNGLTSIAEIIHGSDVIQKQILIDGKKCVQFVEMKDAYVIKLICGEL